MKAVVWRDVGKISVDDVPSPAIQDPADAIVRITTSAICGTDLHFIRGTMSGMRTGTILGREAFPIGEAMNANLTVKMGSCNHRKYIPGLLSKVAGGQADPATVWPQQETIPTALRAYEAFDRRQASWTKVTLDVA